MISCEFPAGGGEPLWFSLYSQIKRQILEGSLCSGQKLPSKRALAAHLGVSVITVQAAYSNLIAEGYIYSIERSGFFVEDLKAFPEGGRNFHAEEEPEPKAEFFADFASNAVCSSKFPFGTWARCCRAVLSEEAGSLLEPLPKAGSPRLRAAIAAHLKDFRNMDAEPARIVIGAGAEILYILLAQILGQGRTFAVENPGYKRMARILQGLGASFVPVGLDSDGIRADLLGGADAVHVTPSHHFPTGIVMSARRRLELLDWAEREGRYIIEDEYDSEFRFVGRPVEPLFSMGKGRRVIYMNTFAKTLSPSFRIGFMLLPPELMQAFKQDSGFSCTVGSVEQHTLAKFIEGGHFSRHIIRMKNYYRSLRNELVQAIGRSRLSSVTRISEQNSGLHFLLEFAVPESGRRIQERLRACGINACLESEYFYGADGAGGRSLVMNYSGIQKERIPEIVRRMEAALAAGE